MVTTGTKHALNDGGNLALARKRHSLPDHMWNNWEIHCTAVFVEMCNINPMTSGDSAFANQAAAQEIVQAEKMAALLDNLVKAFIQKNNTIDKLLGTNQQLAKIIANLTAAIAKFKDRSRPTGQ